MRNILYILILVPCIGAAQFRTQSVSSIPQSAPETAQSGDSSGVNFFGLDLSHLTMRQSASYMMMSGGGQTLGVGAFTNTFLYDFSPALHARADLSLLYSPLNTLGSAAANQINGLQLSNLSLNYSPAKNLNVVVSMQRGPMMMNSWMNPADTFGGDAQKDETAK